MTSAEELSTTAEVDSNTLDTDLTDETDRTDPHPVNRTALDLFLFFLFFPKGHDRSAVG
jgi:hypothetical protein